MSEVIHKENAAMVFDGKVKTDKSDDHILHVLIHKQLLMHARHKGNAELKNRVEKHIDEHIDYLKILYWENNL